MRYSSLHDALRLDVKVPSSSPRSLHRAPTRPVHELYRTLGNQRAGWLMRETLLQAAPNLSQPGDKYEREADHVMIKPQPDGEPLVQLSRQPMPEAQEELQMLPLEDEGSTYDLTNWEYVQITRWVADGRVGIEPLTDDSGRNLDIITRGILCGRLFERGESPHGDPLLCIEEAATRRHRRYQPLRQLIERRLRTIPEPGELTRTREGGPLVIHWPGGGSGVTLGHGYDLGTRTPATIRGDLAAAGLPAGQIEFLVGAAGIRAAAAEAWVAANAANPLARITPHQRSRLFQLTWHRFVERARSRATEPPPGGHSFISEERWGLLHPAVRELVTDLAYVGAPYTGERRDQINAILMDESLNTIQQLGRLRTLVESLPENLQRPHGRQQRLDFIDNTIRLLEE